MLRDYLDRLPTSLTLALGLLLIHVWNAAVRLGSYVGVLVALVRIKRGLVTERSRRSRCPFAVAYIDCDSFKTVNNTSGHKAGDELLRHVAEAAEQAARRTDTVARLGGDEFAILFPEAEPDAAREATERLQRALLGAMQRGNWPVSFSIGLAGFPVALASIDEMIKRADDLMYSVKAGGKNRILERVFE